MSLPSENIESLYRNPIKEVARFFDEKHPNSFTIYNLCNEREYDPKWFHGNVIKLPIPDHNVPTLYSMHTFAVNSRLYLLSNPNNVIAVHCKGGKGRTGVMICAALLNTEICKTADESLELFKNMRTDRFINCKSCELKDQGVTGPSQIRFVHYYEKFYKDIFYLLLKDEYNEKIDQNYINAYILNRSSSSFDSITNLNEKQRNSSPNHSFKDKFYLLPPESYLPIFKDYFNKSITIESISIFHITCLHIKSSFNICSYNV